MWCKDNPFLFSEKYRKILEYQNIKILSTAETNKKTPTHRYNSNRPLRRYHRVFFIYYSYR